MKNITINLPEDYIKVIDKLIKKKIIPSRSEGVRNALRLYLEKDFKNFTNFKQFSEEEIKKK
jgi:metal-responsive CopG/Arc/MetJ family transcriptional regulator